MVVSVVLMGPAFGCRVPGPPPSPWGGWGGRRPSAGAWSPRGVGLRRAPSMGLWSEVDGELVAEGRRCRLLQGFGDRPDLSQRLGQVRFDLPGDDLGRRELGRVNGLRLAAGH